MKNSKSNLDEMQRERRDSIGNQMFLAMFIIFMLDSTLYSIGFRWLRYPTNAMVIILVCLSIYIFRLIAHNAYYPPNVQSTKTIIVSILATMLAIFVTFFIFRILNESPIAFSEVTEEYSALILMAVSFVCLAAILIISVIKRVKDNNDRDD